MNYLMFHTKLFTVILFGKKNDASLLECEYCAN